MISHVHSITTPDVLHILQRELGVCYFGAMMAFSVGM
jgi:hypothetical protein